MLMEHPERDAPTRRPIIHGASNGLVVSHHECFVGNGVPWSPRILARRLFSYETLDNVDRLRCGRHRGIAASDSNDQALPQTRARQPSGRAREVGSVNSPDSELSDRLGAPGMASNSARLAAALLLVLLCVAPIAGFAWGLTAVYSALLACLVTFIAALAGFLVSERFRRSGNQIGYLLGGLVPRMFIPLAACLALYMLGGPLVEAKAIQFLLLFYLVALSTETYLMVSDEKARVGSL